MHYWKLIGAVPLMSSAKTKLNTNEEERSANCKTGGLKQIFKNIKAFHRKQS